MSDKLWRWVASKLPRKLVYLAAIRMWAFATSGDYSDTDASTLTVVDALTRWTKDE